ncbi:type IV secretory system conjugative DNA transfer family protein [Yoonia sp. GPGPB17]|uniref:type IV secretory system conjugative DNA transfer family protein n=1 Tax=Yoonia sp. GPGPB17 TaxID=3026147 RepID=UPI0030C2AFED
MPYQDRSARGMTSLVDNAGEAIMQTVLLLVLVVVPGFLGALFVGMLFSADADEATTSGLLMTALPFSLVGFVIWFRQSPLWGRFFFDPHDSHGSARFATIDETTTLSGQDGLLIGQHHPKGHFLRYDGKAHLMTLAPTRTGKGVGTIIPNLLKVKRPVIVIDPKGENAQITGAVRAGMGPLHVLDPFGISGHPSAAFNPLADLDPDSPDLGEDAAALADALVVDPPDQVQDAHWNEEAKAFITGLILWCVCHEPEERQTLGTLRELLTLPSDKYAALLVDMQDSDRAGELIARAANRQIGKAEREAASVLSNAQRHTHFLDSPRMVTVTGKSDFRFTDLRTQTASVFIVLPPDRLDVYARWLRLVVSQALQDIVRAAQAAPEGVTGQNAAQIPPTLFLLDEFASLGRLTAVERAMGLMAGYGVQLWPILQDLSQLKTLYGQSANTFMANSGVIQSFGVNDYETAKWLSLTIGQETRKFHTKDGKGQKTEGLHARDLLTPDEIMLLDPSLQILKVQGMSPLIAKKIVYYQDERFKWRGDDLLGVI